MNDILFKGIDPAQLESVNDCPDRLLQNRNMPLRK